MSRVEKIEQDVRGLSREELARFRRWFRGYEQKMWDEQLEGDVAEGRLEKLAEEAIAEHKAGRSRML